MICSKLVSLFFFLAISFSIPIFAQEVSQGTAQSDSQTQLNNLIQELDTSELTLDEPKSEIEKSENTKAESACASIDLRQQMGAPLNQGPLGWNLAYVAADLASYKLNQKVSAADLTKQFVKKTDVMLRETSSEKFFESLKVRRRIDLKSGEQVKLIIDDLNEMGFCSAEKINVNMLSVDKHLYESAQNLNKLNLKLSFEPSATIVKESGVFPALKMFEFQNAILQNVVASSEEDRSGLFCNPRSKPVEKLRLGSIGQDDDESTTKTLSKQQLDRINSILDKKTPLGVWVLLHELFDFKDFGVLSAPKQEATEVLRENKKSKNSQIAEMKEASKKFSKDSIEKKDNLNSRDELLKSRHTMALVGRRFNKNTEQCEYILRNTWGPECISGYKVGCESGNLILNEKEFLKVSYRADFIE